MDWNEWWDKLYSGNMRVEEFISSVSAAVSAGADVQARASLIGLHVLLGHNTDRWQAHYRKASQFIQTPQAVTDLELRVWLMDAFATSKNT